MYHVIFFVAIGILLGVFAGIVWFAIEIYHFRNIRKKRINSIWGGFHD